MSKSPLVNDRAQTLLKNLIEHYIRDGQPVGSRTLVKDCKLNLSPATVRNVMSDLEDAGLIVAPHTSSGRIPTDKGYRLFVDSLLTVKPIRNNILEKLKLELPKNIPSEQLLGNASSLLSNVTSMAGVVMVPRREQVTFKHVEFLPLSANRVLVILVVNSEEVQNKVIQTDRAYSSSELQQASGYLNSEFAGLDLTEVRERLLGSMKQMREDMNRIMLSAMDVTDQVLTEKQNSDYVMAGETNLMNYAEMGDIGKLRQLFDAFNTKNDLLHLLDKSIHAEGMQIFIGDESGHAVLQECSVITSPYKVDNQVVGVLGVIGPTRMAYDRVIPIVDVTAKLLSSVLSSE
ncbi:MAG: heat-inducible transcriptional repressor HrcA [Gammaproteobacteria bacterium]|nr:heat-inducible transcriptional repressor HrcA [Gammaproteobacteria bacterium]MDH5777954.1 heat-inducible transcriptional repressor HrcA [Gammaproteobacteria bacterium]